jgi:hypothetical protein
MSDNEDPRADEPSRKPTVGHAFFHFTKPLIDPHDVGPSLLGDDAPEPLN